MTPLACLRAAVLAVALACCMPSAMAADPAAKATPEPAPDPAQDAASAWTHFFAHADFSSAWKAYDLLPDLGYTYASVDADACTTHAAALRDALRKAPVALALHRAAMLCAEAAGDEAAAEREMLAFAGLARHALRQADGVEGDIVRVLRQQDAYALINALGMQAQYEWFEQWHATRTFPILIAAWDPERKRERVMRFDWIDIAQRIARGAEAQFPFHRDDVADAQIRANARANDTASIDYLAWIEARAEHDPRAKLDKLRMAVGAGGVQSAHVWLSYCSEPHAPANCGEGFVDAVLPLAEKKHALPLVQLAYAYGEGVGVPRDAAVAAQLLDAADRRWLRDGGTVRYADMWMDFHGNQPMPAALAARVQRAVANGNERAQLLLIHDRFRRDGKARLRDDEVAFLSSKAMNRAGEGFALLASVAEMHKQEGDAERYERLAADAGDADMQARRASRLLYGEGKRDEGTGRRLLVDAAHGADAWAARNLAYRALDEGDGLAAERWLLQPARAGDTDSILAIANVYASGAPGTTGNAKRAVEIYRGLAGDSAVARRRLAVLAAAGQGMAQDTALARRLWLQDAEAGDHDAQAELGQALLEGRIGAADEREGTRWIERAIAGGNRFAASGYAYWLYYRKGTPDSRAQALDVWRKALARGDDGVDNNLAWVLCTAPFDDVRDPKAGLAIVEKMGATVDMPVHILDTVAACHAANGNFAEARRAQTEAVAQIDAVRAKRAQAKAAAAEKAAAEKVAAETGAAGENAVAAKSRVNAKVASAKQDAPETDEFEAAGYRERLALYADGKPYLDSPERRE